MNKIMPTGLEDYCMLLIQAKECILSTQYEALKAFSVKFAPMAREISSLNEI